MKIRAPARIFTPVDLLNSSFTDFDALDTPSPAGSAMKHATRITTSSSTKSHRAGLKPTVVSSSPPTKKPIPLVAFLDPVNQATQRNSWLLPSTEVILMADLEAVLVMSLATPATPCAATTQITDTAAPHAGLSSDRNSSPPICKPIPKTSIRWMPNRDASHPPARLAMIPAASYSKNKKARVNGE